MIKKQARLRARENVQMSFFLYYFSFIYKFSNINF